MKSAFFFLVFINLYSFSFSQSKFGYIGKKNMFSFFTTESVSFFPNINHHSSQKYDENNTLKKSGDAFRIDYRMSYHVLLSNRVAIGAEFGYNELKVRVDPTPFYLPSFDTYTYPPNPSSPVFKTFSYFLSFKFFDSGRIEGAGFSTSFGLGAKYYFFKSNENYRYTEDIPMPKDSLFPSYDSSIKGYNAFFEMSYSRLLTRFLSFEIGLRFHTGFILKKEDEYKTDKGYVWVKDNVYDRIYKENLMNFASFKTGFVILI